MWRLVVLHNASVKLMVLYNALVMLLSLVYEQRLCNYNNQYYKIIFNAQPEPAAINDGYIDFIFI